MRTLFRLSEARATTIESPTRPLTDATLIDVLGGTPTEAGVTINENSAMNIIAVFRGVSLISSAVAGLPLKAYRYGSREVVTHPALGDQLVPAQPGTTTFERWETTVAHMLLWGNAYLRKVYEPSGRIVDLVPIHPARVKVTIEKENGRAYKAFTLDGREILTDLEVLHLPCLSLDGVTGVSPVGKVRQSLGIATEAEKTAARLFGNGNMMSGVLKTDRVLEQGQADRLKAQWRAKMHGSDKAHEVAVLDAGTEFQPVSMPPADVQFLESRKFQVTEIARWLGLPGWMLNDQEKSTSWGTGMEQQFQTWVMLSLKPYLQRIEARVTLEVLTSRYFAEFVIEGLLRGDSRTRAAFYSSGISNGWLVPNEIRRRENLPPVSWGDVPYLPNNTPADRDPAAPNDDQEDDA